MQQSRAIATNLQRPPFRSVLLFLLCLFLQGCVFPSHSRVVQNPPLTKKVPMIVKGQTTRAEILKYFGPPDIEADGAKITLHPDSVMGQHRAEAKKNWIKLHERMLKLPEKHRVSMGVTDSFDPHWLDKLANLKPYSSIDDEHVAFLYIEIRVKGSTSLRNKLLIFINKKTDIVDEFAYREEFKAD